MKIKNSCLIFKEEEVKSLFNLSEKAYLLLIEEVKNIFEKKDYSFINLGDNANKILENSFYNNSSTFISRMDYLWDGKSFKLIDYNAENPSFLGESYFLCDDEHYKKYLKYKINKWLFDNKINSITLLLSNPVLEEDLVKNRFFKEVFDINYSCINEDALLFDGSLKINNNQIEHIYKVLSFQDMLCKEYFYLHENWLEPLWTFVLSSKELLLKLYESNNELDFLVKTSKNNDLFNKYIKKPINGMGSLNVEVYENKELILETKKGLIPTGYIYQEYIESYILDNDYNYIFCVWLINGKSSFLTVRRDSSIIVGESEEIIPWKII